MKISKIITFGIVAMSVPVIGLFNSAAYAQGVNVSPTRTVEPTRITQIIDNIAKARCDRVKSRVDERVNIYNARRDFYQKRHDLAVQRADEIIKRLEGKGYDLTKIKADREQLTKLRNEFVTLHEKLVQSLVDLRTSTCNGANKAEFDAKLQAFQESLRLQREKAKEISSYIKNTLIPDIKDLRNKIEKNN